jgi:hypothetical protein
MGQPVASLDPNFYCASGNCLLIKLPLLLLHALTYASATRHCKPLHAFANTATAAYVPSVATTIVSAAVFLLIAVCCLTDTLQSAPALTAASDAAATIVVSAAAFC